MATFKTIHIDKHHLLENSNYGLDFYEHVLGELKLANSTRCENIHNPFYGDSKAALSIFFADDMWRYNDYGDSSYSGDVFSFAAYHFELDVKEDFGKILHLMYEALGINKPEKTEEIDDLIYEFLYKLPGSRRDAEGVDLAYNYFKQYGITKEILRDFTVRGIRSYYYIDKQGQLKQWHYRKDQTALAYEEINHVKLYHPGSTEHKFQYRGHKPQDYVFGQKQIIRNMIKTRNWERDILVIAAGEKDTMTLVALGYDAICLNSETARSIPEQLEDSIINNYKYIVILYDNDATGQRAAEQLQKRHGFKICKLPSDLALYGGKDVSDYVKLALDQEKLRSAIEQAAKASCLVFGNKDEKIFKIRMYSGYINSKGEVIGNTIEGEDVNLCEKISHSEDHLTPEGEPVIEIGNEGEDPLNDVIQPLRNRAPESIISPSDIFHDRLNSPLFPDEIFAALPNPLENICKQFTDKRERDIILFSSISMLSSFFPTLKSINDGRIMGANLNFFISAPAASGKGTANWAKKLGEGVQRYLREKYKKEFAQYMVDIKKYAKAAKKNEESDQPQMPMRKSLFIPANNSVSKVYEMLAANENFGIIFETEGDTLTGALKNEWGNFSDVIRKCFHHETISLARRADDELIEVENPHLSVFLTGTPEQISGLIQSVENGFFSRFGFYDFESELIWKSQFKKNDTSIHIYFQHVAEYFYRMWLRHEAAPNTFVHISDKLIVLIDSYFEKKQALLCELHGKDIVASVNRTCVIWQRIAMILCALRHLEKEKTLPARLEISEQDGLIALKIVDVMLSHLQIVFARMKGSSVSAKLNAQQLKVWQSLPSEFDRKEFEPNSKKFKG